LLSLLAILNSNLALACKQSAISASGIGVNSINYLYFMQNDARFCQEYVKFVKSLAVPLIENSLNAKKSNYDAYLGNLFFKQ
jgi:hypothetical protein